MASLHFPPLGVYSPEPIQRYRVELPPGSAWVDRLSYQDSHFACFDPRANLTADGQIRGTRRW